MKKNYFSKKGWLACIFFCMLITANVFAQVGIGTTTPHPSSVLDVSSTTQGMLTPRLTTAQRIAIASPADGLMVYDTDLKSFYHYNISATSWSRMSSDANGRLKFKRIKSTDVLATVLAAEKTAGGNTKYLLDPGTLYEINGTILVDLPIELNEAYIAGLDSGEDKLVKGSGDLFMGTTGGSIKVLTLVAGGKVFNITGDGTKNLIFRDCIVANSGEVGLIKGFSMVFLSIVQYVGNSNGVTYENINRLLLSNTGWFGGGAPLGNSGTYEKLVGTFGSVQKQSGFSEVTGTNIGFDVSANPIITGDAVMDAVVFTGTVSTGKYVNGYTIGSYTGYNFSNRWSVDSAGIPREDDAVATGNMNFDYAVGSGASTTFNSSNPSNTVKLLGTSTSGELFRFSTDGGTNNRLKYLGLKKRFFKITGSVSFQVSSSGIYIIYTSKNGTPISQYKIYGKGLVSNDILVLPLIASVELSTNDYVEIYVQRYSGGSSDYIITPNLNIVMD